MKHLAIIFIGTLVTVFSFAKTNINSPPGIPVLTDIAMDGPYVIHMQHQIDAEKYCQSLGLHLPTIRELALWATQYGAGVSDIQKYGYEEVASNDPAGYPDDFYYYFPNLEGSQIPSEGGFGPYWYWSSSSVPNTLYVYDFNADYGEVGINASYDDSIDNAVRCVLSN